MELFDFVRIARTAVSTTRRVVTASIVGIGNVGDDASAERVDNCEVAQPLGLFAVPVLTPQTEGVVARLADRPFVLFVLDKGRTAQACEDGGTKLYGVGPDNAAAIVYIRATGAIEVTSVTNTNVILTAGGTGTVRFQDGSQAFVRGTQYATALVTYLSAENSLLSATSVFLGLLTTYVTAIQVIADPTNAATPVLTAGIATLQASIATRITSVTAFANSAANAPTGWLSTKVFGQ